MSLWIPYQPPAVQSQPRQLSNLPARRSALLMLVLALILAGFGGLMAAMGHVLTTSPLPPELQSQIRQIESQIHRPFPVFVHLLSVTLLTVGIVVGLLSAWVRRGSLLAVVLAILLDGAALLLIVIALLSGVAAMLTVGGPQVLASVSVWIVALAVCGLLFSWLLQAARSARQLAPAVANVVAPPTAAPRAPGLGYGAFSPPPPLPRNRD